MAHSPLTGTRSNRQQKHLQWNRGMALFFLQRSYRWCFRILPYWVKATKFHSHNTESFQLVGWFLVKIEAVVLGTKGSWNTAETAQCEGGGGRQGPARAPARFSTLDLHQTHGSKVGRTQGPLLASTQVPPAWQLQVATWPVLWPYFRKGPTGAGLECWV